MQAIIVESWVTLCVLAPWLLFGAFLAGLLHVALPPDWLRKNLQGNGGVIKAVVLGVPLPLCSCGVIPAGIGLKKNGASDGAALGFLISTPQTGVDSVLVSASIFGWPFAIFKMLLAALTGIVGGCLAHQTAGPTESEKTMEDSLETQRPWIIRWLNHSIELIQSIWRWLAAGILVSAIISVWIVPTGTFQQIGDAGLLVSLLLVLLVSLPLYVCATASVPIAAALVAGGIPVAAALVFLIAGPATNFATIGAIYSQFGIRNTVTYLATIVLGSICGAIFFDWAFGTTTIESVTHLHEHLNIISMLSGILLLGCFLWFGLRDVQFFLRKRNSQTQLPHTAAPQLLIPVQGMNCQSCVRKIETSLLKNPGVEHVKVDLEQGRVKVFGNVDPATARESIRQAGFQAQSDPVAP